MKHPDWVAKCLNQGDDAGLYPFADDDLVYYYEGNVYNVSHTTLDTHFRYKEWTTHGYDDCCCSGHSDEECTSGTNYDLKEAHVSLTPAIKNVQTDVFLALMCANCNTQSKYGTKHSHSYKGLLYPIPTAARNGKMYEYTILKPMKVAEVKKNLKQIDLKKSKCYTKK